MAPRILVLGAGINGLSSAVCVQQACPLAQVQLVAEHFSPDTTSDGAGGSWGPYLLGDTDQELILRLSEITYNHLLRLANSSLAGVVKAQKISGYHLYRNLPAGRQFWRHLVAGFRQLTDEEMKQYPLFDSGTFYTAVTVDVTPYLSWLMKRFKACGGTTRQARVDNIEEVAADFDIVINCTGLASRRLFNDDDVFPIRGQVWKKVKKPNPAVLFCFLPALTNGSRVEYLTVGGTSQVGDWNTRVDPADSAAIWNKAVTIFPMLKHATPLEVWAGLRPARKSLRLEMQAIETHGRSIKVIHNYGHSGSGITLHWGCALEVTAMVLEALGTEKEHIKRVVSRL
ncbi:D-aspartate oxidase [Elysia marginata]|uniref:D-aspartate oxidase n=1 Tax=Elysia marginata TaxID=1093978 RepID=A0AAV4II54_9GAST|nr:D-aspartate oxidase [Elysia marginata]